MARLSLFGKRRGAPNSLALLIVALVDITDDHVIWPLAGQIDHVLVSERVHVLGLETGPNIGSDHHPLVLDAGF